MSFLPSLIRSFMKRYILVKMAPPSPASLMRFDLRPSPPPPVNLARAAQSRCIYSNNVSKEGTRYRNTYIYRDTGFSNLLSRDEGFVLPRHQLSQSMIQISQWTKDISILIEIYIRVICKYLRRE